MINLSVPLLTAYNKLYLFSSIRKNLRKNSHTNTSTRGFSNTLPSPRRRQHLSDVLGDDGIEGGDGGDGQADALYRTTPPMRSDSDTITTNRNNVSYLIANLF